jgi:hypothetical protein
VRYQQSEREGQERAQSLPWLPFALIVLLLGGRMIERERQSVRYQQREREGRERAQYVPWLPSALVVLLLGGRIGFVVLLCVVRLCGCALVLERRGRTY